MSDTNPNDAATSEGELLAWRMRVDDFMDEANIQRRMTAIQMGALEASVIDLQGDVRESNEWSRKNHEALTTMVGFFEGMENVRKLANTITKWAKPFLLIAGTVAAIVAYVKTGEWRAP